MSRAIDKAENAILDVLGHMDDGLSYDEALSLVAGPANYNPDRLRQLTNVWSAIAGVRPEGLP